MKCSSWVAILMFLVFLFMLGLWTIDVSVSTMLVGDTVMTSGWFVRDPMLSYHLGLYLTAASNFSIAIILVHLLVRDSVDIGTPGDVRDSIDAGIPRDMRLGVDRRTMTPVVFNLHRRRSYPLIKNQGEEK